MNYLKEKKPVACENNKTALKNCKTRKIPTNCFKHKHHKSLTNMACVCAQ